MRLTCALVLFAFALLQQGPSPTPRTVPSTGIASQVATDKNKRDTNSKGQIPNQSPSATELASSPDAADQNGSPVAPNNGEQPVRITVVPPVTIKENWTDKFSVVLAAVLALVGVIGIIVAIRTLKIIERQTKATETAADAAKDNAKAALLTAQAMINSERAWITAKVERYQSTEAAFSVVITNLGRTPARILWYGFNFFLVPIEITKLSDFEQKSEVRINRQIFLAADRPHSLADVDIVQGYRRESWEKVLGGQVTLVCRGHIHYGGVVGDQEHDTWFCFSFSTHRHAFSAEGLPPEYNRYT